MLPFYALVLVRAKRWHQSGAINSPFKQVRLLGPSPMMHHGWAVQDEEGYVQHARVALLPSAAADQAEYELQLTDGIPVPRTRLTGKQSLDPVIHVGEYLASGKLDSMPALDRAGGESLRSLQTSLKPTSEHSSTTSEYSSSHPPALGEKTGIVYHEPSGWSQEDWMLECHWRLRQLLDEEMRRVPTTSEEGSLQGSVIEALDAQVQGLERDLNEKASRETKIQLKALVSEEAATEKEVKVLQTYTVSTADVKRELSDWIPALKTEYNQLTTVTGAIQPISEDDLKKDPTLAGAELIPGKLVATIKALDAKRKARLVICGNLVPEEKTDLENLISVKAQNYAGGIDSTALRAVLRKGASQGWQIATTDIRTAFLLAPRTRDERTLVVRPPRIMCDAGICREDELWLVRKALYGLTTSPADWAVYRDSVLKTFEWNDGGFEYWMQPTREQNVWKLMRRREGQEKASGVMSGLCSVYVDDILTTGDTDTTRSFLKRLQKQWTCSTPEWVSHDKISGCAFVDWS